jgi:glutathione S-transferase
MLDAHPALSWLTDALVALTAAWRAFDVDGCQTRPVQILHIATASDWSAAVATGSYRVSTLGVTIDEEGFIHASLPEQVQGTASRFYADVREPLVVLVMRTEALEAAGVPVRFEDAGNGEVFPHLYAALPGALVDEALPAAFDAEGTLVY